MTYALSYDVPADQEMYARVSEAVGDEQPKGLLAHLVVEIDGGLRHIGVWDSAEDWQRFHDERVEPAIHAVLTAAGFTTMPPEPTVDELKLVDFRLGS
jgi:hypothetical protein